MNKKILSIIFLAFALFFSFQFLMVYADSATERCAPLNKIKTSQAWPQSPIGGYTLDSNSKLPQLVGYFFGWGVGLGGIAVFIALIIAGVEYITSIADPNKVKDARARIQSSLVGLVLLLSSWAIFNLINPNLTRLTSPNNTINQNGAISLLNRVCNDNSECCEIIDPNCDPTTLTAGATCPKVTNPACNPKYWACCKVNDKICLSKGKEALLGQIGEKCKDPSDCMSGYCDMPMGLLEGKCAQGRSPINSPCTHKGECASAYCSPETNTCQDLKREGVECGRDSDCESGKCECDSTVWKRKCAQNPKVCNMTFDQPVLGCDLVRFYQSRNFAGAYIEFKASGDNTVPPGQLGAGTLNADWTFWHGNPPTGYNGSALVRFTSAPMSYQSFAYQKDAYGDYVYYKQGGGTTKDISKAERENGGPKHILLSCGETACGCMIARCISVNAGVCAQDTTDPNSGSFGEFAYNPDVDKMEGAKIKDKTKQSWIQKGEDWAGDMAGLGKQAYCLIFGCE